MYSRGSNRNKLVYLAGPIDSACKVDSVEWRNRAAVIWARYGYAVFNPHLAYGGQIEKTLHAHAITKINYNAIDHCQLVMVRFTEEFTLGTIREIEYARARFIPVYLFTENRGLISKIAASISSYDCKVIEEPFMADAISQMHFMETNSINAVYGGEPASEESENGS